MGRRQSRCRPRNRMMFTCKWKRRLSLRARSIRMRPLRRWSRRRRFRSPGLHRGQRHPSRTFRRPLPLLRLRRVRRRGRGGCCGGLRDFSSRFFDERRLRHTRRCPDSRGRLAPHTPGLKPERITGRIAALKPCATQGLSAIDGAAQGFDFLAQAIGEIGAALGGVTHAIFYIADPVFGFFGPVV